MLQKMRDKTKGAISWLIVGMIILVFTLCSVNSRSSWLGGNKAAATVDGQVISWREINHLTEKYKQYLLTKNPEEVKNLDLKALQNEILQEKIQELALLSQLKKQGFLVTEQELKTTISKEAAFQENGKFSPEKYREFANKTGLSEDELNATISKNLSIRQPINGLQSSNFVLEEEINNLKNLYFQERDFGYMIIPAKTAGSNLEVSKEEIEDYYKQHQHLFINPEQIKLSYVELNLDNLSKSISVTEEELEQYYQKHQANYIIPEQVKLRHIVVNAPKGSDLEKSGEARAKIDDLLARTKLGEDFVALAKKYSDDPGSTEVFNLTKGQTFPEFEKVAFGLENPGTVSDVFQSEHGFHILQLVEKQPEKTQNFVDIKEQITEHYRRELAENQFVDKSEELASLSFEYKDSIQEVAEKMQLQIQETELLSRENSSGIASIPAVAAVAFSSDFINRKVNSDLIKVDDERYVVFRIAKHIPSRPLELSEVTAKIKDLLLIEKGTKQAATIGTSLLEKLQKGNTPHAIAKEAHLTWNTETEVDRAKQNINPYIIEKAFSIAKPDPKTPVNVGFSLPSGDYAIISLQKIKINEKANSPMIEQQFAQQLEKITTQNQTQLYIQSLINKAKITN